RVRPERELGEARGIDRQRLAVAATEVEVVVERAAVVALVDVDEAGAVLREDRRSVTTNCSGLDVSDRRRGVGLDRAAPGGPAVDRREPKCALRLQVGRRPAEVEKDRPVRLAYELGGGEGGPAGDDRACCGAPAEPV